MTRKFKPGDKVLRTIDSGAYGITVPGQIYTVKRTKDNGHIALVECPDGFGYSMKSFTLVSTAPLTEFEWLDRVQENFKDV
jgi:hypothetical protein